MSRSFLRLTLVLGLLACVLGVVIWYLYRPPAMRALAAIDGVSSLVLTVEGVSTHMVRLNGLWQADPPQNMPLDQEAIADIVRTAKTVQSRRTLSATTANLETFGLLSSRNHLVLNSETASVHMVYGRHTFDGADVYMRVLGNPEVFLVSTERVQHLLRQRSELRDPYLFGVPSADTLDRLVLELPGRRSILMVRHGVFWLLEDAQKQTLHLVDRAYLDQLISALGSLSVQHFVQMPSLKKSQALSRLTFQAGEIQRELFFFWVSGLLFVALPDYPNEVFQVSSEFEDHLRHDWVAERPFLMDRFSLDAVTVDTVAETSSEKKKRDYHKKPTGKWQSQGQDATLWVHNFFVHLSALARMMPAVPPTVIGPDYAVVLRMGTHQSHLDITRTETTGDGDPLLRVRLMGRTMWVRDPGGQFIAHMLGHP